MVLACNNYDIVDLGVMVPPQRILEVAREEKVVCDRPVRTHSTPSLDEMVHLASEMEREGFEIPLPDRRGGHHVEGAYRRQDLAAVLFPGLPVYVLDASRAVGVVGNLLSAKRRDGFVADIRTEYAGVAERPRTRPNAPRNGCRWRRRGPTR